jgi:hypothetical protein
MTLEKERRTIGVFARCSDTQLVLQQLKASNFPMHKVSLIARNAEEQSDIAGVEVKKHIGNTFEEDVTGAVTRDALGDFSDLLLGIVFWAVPGIGPVMVAGAEATAIATTLAITLPGVLLSLGIPEKQAQGYSDLVCKGYYLVIVTGLDIEIRFAKRLFNRCDLQEWGVFEPYSTPDSRYKHAVGVFYTHQDAKRALTELTNAGFPMSNVSIVAKNISKVSELNVSNSQYNYTTLGFSDDLARYYQDQLTLDHYLVVLKGTDIYIAGARAILENNNIQHFSIYSQCELDTSRSDR